MVLKNISEWLFPGDGDGSTAPPSVSVQVGAAGLLVAAAHRDGRYTEVEKDSATAALMKLFHLGNPDASQLRQEAEQELFEGTRGFVTFASAAKQLDREEQEMLIRRIWELVGTDGETLGENIFVSSVRDFLGFTRAQADALRPSED